MKIRSVLIEVQMLDSLVPFQRKKNVTEIYAVNIDYFLCPTGCQVR